MMEAFQIGLPVTFLGMGIVFCVLIILWGILELFRIFFYEMPLKKAKAAKEAAAAEPIPASVEPLAAAPAPVVPQEDGFEIIAVLTAAIAASMGTSESGFAIKSFKKVSNTNPAWGMASIREQLDNTL